MPELPEVETTANLVRPGVEGRRVRAVEVDWLRTLGGATVEEFTRAVVGARVARVGRRAKYVRLDLERGGHAAGALLVHLRMTGRLVVTQGREPTPAWRKVSLRLDRGALHFLDVRKFGRFTFHADPEAALAHLGPEPLGSDFTAEGLASGLRSRRRALKPLLLDQEFVAGLGNIYVDEALHRAGLHPLRSSASVRRSSAERLHAAIQDILARAIEREGSSFDTFYRTPEGKPGEYQHLFQVYGRDGQACRTCGTTIRKLVVGQRGTHVCPRCQPVPRGASRAGRS